jgi:hypothetical protein
MERVVSLFGATCAAVGYYWEIEGIIRIIVALGMEY